jgi:hypothetical protein
MTLISEIIEEAFREGDFVGEDNNPTPRQAQEAVRAINNLIAGIYGGDAGERLNDWPLGTYGVESSDAGAFPSTDTLQRPTINRRMISTNLAAMTVYMTPAPQDGARMGIADPFSRLAAFPVTLDANGRTIETTATLLLNTNGLNREWFYRADLGGWVRLSDLTADSALPFPEFFDNMFSILLALRLAPRFGREISSQSLAILKQKRTEFLARYIQSQPLEILDDISWPFMSTQSYDTQREFSSNRAFDRGSYPWNG